MADMSFLNHNQIANLLASLIGERVTVVIEGENGIGKSALYETLRKMPKFSKHYFTPIVDCQNLDVGDHMVPVPDFNEGVTRNLPNDRYGICKDNHAGLANARPVVNLLDEIGKAPRHVQATLAPWFYEHRLGQYYAPVGSIIIGTTNLAVEGLSDSMLAHTRNRITSIYMKKPTAQEWTKWGMEHGIDAQVLAFAEMYPQAWKSFIDAEYEGKDLSKENPYIFNPRAQQQAYLSPRSAERASTIIKRSRGALDDDTLRAALVGTIGGPAANDMWAIMALHSEIVRYEEVLLDPLKAKLCKNNIAQIIQVFQFITRVNNRAEAAKVVKYVARMRAEAQALFCRKVSEAGTRVANFVTIEEFKNMMLEHQVVFQGRV